jgi:S-adenosylmethionine hydrolase
MAETRLVTLTTDFGDADGYVGAMKGVIHTAAPGITIVDIAHSIPRHDVVAAAHALVNAAPHFPPGTIHVAVVDPGVGGDRKPVIVVDAPFLYVGPDNGIFSLVAPRPQAAHEITDPRFRRERASATFHGRDVFAAAAGRLAVGAPLDEAGPQVVLRGRLPVPGAPGGHHVLHIDVFGNLITGIAREKIPPQARFRVAGREIERLSDTYESVAAGELLAYIGSRGTLEIAVREGSASEVLGAARGTAVEIATPEDAA